MRRRDVKPTPWDQDKCKHSRGARTSHHAVHSAATSEQFNQYAFSIECVPKVSPGTTCKTA